MKKILILIVILLVVGGAVYFITNKKPQEEGTQEEGVNDAISERNQARGFQADNFPAGTVEDLTVGEEVTVSGAENPDGSIAAAMIIIGTLEDRPEFSDFSNRPMPEGFNPEEFQNLSQEERMQRMQEFRANTGGNFRAGGGRMVGGAASIRGEIIDKDETIITVKLIDGGSKLVFYSDDTEIRIQK